MWYGDNMLDAVLFIFVDHFVVRGCEHCHEEVYRRLQ